MGRLVGFAPDRIEAAIVSHGGQGAPLGLDTISLSGAALKIPVLILVGVKTRLLEQKRPTRTFQVLGAGRSMALRYPERCESFLQ